MIELRRTDSENPDFVTLVESLDRDLAQRDGEDHAFYHQFNSIKSIRHAIVAYDDGHAVACGAIKAFNDESMEVKRMYTIPSYRGKGIAAIVLSELEKWTTELGYASCVLETGMQQPEAMALYRKHGYEAIPNYGQYIGVSNSRCFKKRL